MKKKYSIADIKNSYDKKKLIKEKKNDFFMYLIYRPISFYFTPPFLKLKISANIVSLMNLFICLLLPASAFINSSLSFVYIAILTFFYFILDCVDGNIARITQKSTPLGQYLDSFAGKLFWISLYSSIGLLTTFQEKNLFGKWGVVVGLLAGIFYIFGRESRAFVKFNFSQHFPKSFLDRISFLSIFLSSVELAPFMLIILGYFNSIDWLLIFFLAHSFLFFAGSQKMIFSTLRNIK